MYIQRIFSRTIAIIMICVGTLGLLASLLFGAIALGKFSLHNPGAQVPYVPQMDPSAAGEELIPFDLSEKGYGMVNSMWLETYADLTIADELHAASWFITFFVPGVACALIVALSVLLLLKRPFALFTGVSLIGLGVLTGVSAFLLPAFEAWATSDIVRALDVPTEGGVSKAWVVPPHYDWLQDTYWSYVFLGIIVALGGVLALRARSLFMDLEGTI